VSQRCRPPTKCWRPARSRSATARLAPARVIANAAAGGATAEAGEAATRLPSPRLRRLPAAILPGTDRIEPRPLPRLGITAAVVAAALLAWWAGRSLAPRLLDIVAHIQSLGPAAPAAFIVIYTLAVVALIPGSILTVAGGAVFGLVRGVIFGLVGATLGSTAAFLIGRYAARRLVARRLAAMPRFQAIEKAVSARGRRIVFLLRLSPVVPFNFLNYVLGLTTISVWDFVAASLGSVPGTLVYAYTGKVTGEALALAGQAEVPRNASYYAVLLAGLVATVAATTVVTRTARRALQDV
jgi:uncharacterized membrane protein YdjX (TVP38/TMEM64 family)